MRPLVNVLVAAFLALAATGAFAQGVTLPDFERIELDNGAVLILTHNYWPAGS